MTFNYIELFAGIGGFRQALERLGGRCVFASEIDKFAKQSYEALYGERPAGDITQIEAEDIPDHDLIVGGFPCQAFSVAGQRKGFEDTRGTLFFEIVRIAREKKPAALLLENVKGLVNHDKGRTLDVMISTLCEIGYTVDFDILNSKYFGVPQNRERIFIIAVRDDIAKPEPWDIEGNTVVPRGKKRIQALDGIKTFNFDWPEQGEVTSRLRDILETDVDEKYYLSDDKTAKLVAQLEEREEPQVLRPQRTEYGKKIRKEYERGDVWESRHKMRELQPRKDGISNTLTTVVKDNYLAEPQMLGHVDLKGHDAIKRVYSTESVRPTLTTMCGGHREPKIAEEQAKLNIIGHSGSGGQKGHKHADDGLMSTLTATDYEQPKQIAQEVRPVLTPDRAEKRQNGRRFKGNGEESFTLTSQDRHGVAIGEYPRYRIRKLTPLECWRLQGFSDSSHEAVKSAGISDSQRYKQAGNAVTVNVIEAIGQRLLPIISEDSTKVSEVVSVG